MLAVKFPVFIGDGPAVEQQIALLRRIESGDDFGESCLAAAVPARQNHQLAGFEIDIDRPQSESLFLSVAVIDIADRF